MMAGIDEVASFAGKLATEDLRLPASTKAWLSTASQMSASSSEAVRSQALKDIEAGDVILAPLLRDSAWPKVLEALKVTAPPKDMMGTLHEHLEAMGKIVYTEDEKLQFFDDVTTAAECYHSGHASVKDAMKPKQQRIFRSLELRSEEGLKTLNKNATMAITTILAQAENMEGLDCKRALSDAQMVVEDTLLKYDFSHVCFAGQVHRALGT